MLKVSARTGLIELVAGQHVTSYGGDNGPAIDALFWNPIPSGVNRNGDLYITDFENSRIRKVSAVSGMVTTIAGSGDCPTTGVLPFNVPVCQGGFGGDGGPATKAILHHAQGAALDVHGNLYIADTINHRIRRIDGTTGIIETIAGTGLNGFSGDGGPALSAQLSFPVSIAVDHNGTVYVADENNQRIRVLTPGPSRFRPMPRH